MTKPHGSNPRAVRAARSRQQVLQRAEKIEARRQPKPAEPTPTITVADLERAMEALRDAPRQGCPPHLVHPRYAGWELDDGTSDGAEVVRCASLCDWAAFMRPPQ